jgi:hypothetical protein
MQVVSERKINARLIVTAMPPENIRPNGSRRQREILRDALFFKSKRLAPSNFPLRTQLGSNQLMTL